VHKKCLGVILGLYLFFLLGAVSAFEADVAYVLEDSSQVSQRISNSLSSVGLSYDVIRDSALPSTDFGEYSVVLIVEEVDKVNFIPFDDISAMFLDRDIAEEVWNVGSSGTSLSNKIEADDEDSFVFDGINVPSNDEVSIYSGSGPIHYLNNLAEPGITVAAVKTGTNRPIIAYEFNGIGEYTIKNLFFGIYDPSSWNSNSELMFKNSILWLIGDVDQDEDGWLFADDCDDLDPDTHPEAVEIPYDGKDQDCDGNDLADVDGDGYDSDVVGGLDCIDTNPLINPDNPNPLLNCVNDAPIIAVAPALLEALETQFVIVNVIAIDPDHDELEYTMNDPRFVWDGVDNFIWETGYEDEGEYEFVITVSDGDLEDKATVMINVNKLNRAPVSTDIPTVTWEEDSAGAQIDLNDYFVDLDGDALVYGVEGTSAQTEIMISSGENGIIDFSSEKDFFGEDWVVFFAWDGVDEANSNQITLIVSPVNDPVIFEGEIGSIEWNEDESFESAIRLKEYFLDIDSELEYKVFGNDKIDVVVDEGGFVSLYPEEDFFGTEQIYFEASDGEFSAISNTVTLIVLDAGEPPVFSELTCETVIDEDVEMTCNLEATDFEGDNFEFSIDYENNLDCSIDGDVLTYASKKDYFGSGSCELVVDDGLHGSSMVLFEVNINPVNDAPVITSKDPQENVVTIIEGFEKEFNVNAEDVDSNLNVRWSLNGNLQKENQLNSNVDKFVLDNLEPGTYFLGVEVFDEEFEENTGWTIIVGQLEDYSCSEIGGNICGEDNACTDPVFETEDTVSCCLSTCRPGFKDVNSCDVISDNLIIEINNPEENENVELKEDLEVDITVINEFNDDQKFDVEIHLYNVDDDKSVEKIKENLEVNEGDSEDLEIEFRIPENLDVDDEYYLFVKVEDDICSETFVPLDLERAESDVIISKFELPTAVVCGESVDAEIRVENIGSRDQDVLVSLESIDLDVYELVDEFELEEYDGDDDKENVKFSFVVPEGVESGVYEIEASVLFDVDFEVFSKEITVECLDGEEIELETETLNYVDDGNLALNSAREKAEQSEEKKPNYLLMSWVILIDFLLIGSIGILYLAWEKSKVGKK
jgi:hypothetical protein